MYVQGRFVFAEGPVDPPANILTGTYLPSRLRDVALLKMTKTVLLILGGV